MKKISLLVFYMLFLSLHSLFSQDTEIIDRVIATVGSKVVLKSDVEIQLLQARQRGELVENIRCDIFEDLLFQKLLLNQAMLDSIEVSEKEIEAQLSMRLETFIEQMGSQENLENYYNKSIFEIKNMFYDIVEDQLLSQQMQYTITEGITITPAEVRDFYLTINKDSLPLIDTKIEYQKIRIYPVISEEERQIAYDKIEEFRKKIEDGTKKFETIAIMYSEDSYSATKGGELGFMGRGELDPEFAATAFLLEKDEVSEVIETQFGLHIIKNVERRGEKINCKHILISPKVSVAAKIEARNRLDSIKSLLLVDSITFENAALFFSEDKDTYKSEGKVINPYSGDTKFDIEKIDPRIRVVLDKMKPNEISKPNEIMDETGKICYEIYKLKSKSEPHVANLEQDYEEIRALALQDKQNTAIDKWIRNKQRLVYINISDEYKACPYKYNGWLK